MIDVEQVLSDLETLWGINPPGKTTVDIPVKLVADIIDSLKEQEAKEQAEKENHPCERCQEFVCDGCPYCDD